MSQPTEIENIKTLTFGLAILEMRYNDATYYDLDNKRTVKEDMIRLIAKYRGKIAMINWKQKEDRNTCLKHIMNHFDKQDFSNDMKSIVSDACSKK